MKRITKLKMPLFLLTFLGIASFLFAPYAFADEEENQTDTNDAVGFTYKIEFPENQMEPNVGYFKLRMASGQQQKLRITLSNPSAEKTTVSVGINSAKTNQNGVIEYGDSTIEKDASLKFDFIDIVTGPKTVDLEPGETKDLELMVQMPETSAEGIIAGGIQLMRTNQGNEQKNDGGSKIINQYAYVVGVLLQMSDQLAEPELKLNYVKVGHNNYRNSIFVNFSNIIANYVNDMTVEVQVSAKDDAGVLYERKQTAMRMAPNSFIEFPIGMNGEQMQEGMYVANILITADGKTWKWEKEFEIKKEEADKFNERDVGLVQEKGIDWKLIAMLVAGILGVIVIIFAVMVMVRKKKEKAANQRKELRKEQSKKTAKRKQVSSKKMSENHPKKSKK